MAAVSVSSWTRKLREARMPSWATSTPRRVWKTTKSSGARLLTMAWTKKLA